MRLTPLQAEHRLRLAVVGLVCAQGVFRRACVDAPGYASRLRTFEQVIGCGHVSGLIVAALHEPRAGMAILGLGPDQICEL